MKIDQLVGTEVCIYWFEMLVSKFRKKIIQNIRYLFYVI
jgi:hypothetical protein